MNFSFKNALFISLRQSGCRQFYNLVPNSRKHLSFTFYYHLRSTMKCESFFAHVNFSNETVSQTTPSTGPMKMVSFGARNYECLSKKCSTFCSGLTKLTTFFRVFSLVSLRLQKDGGATSKKNLDKPIALEHRRLKLSL